jgi:hypothetical protein
MSIKNEDRNQFRFDVDCHSDTDGYKKVQWMMDQNLPWATWLFTAYAIWLNDDEQGRKVAVQFRLTFD